MTERLYFTDSYLLDFSASVVEHAQHLGRPGVVLDRTAFYPTGGGQPNDTGSINRIPIADVVELDEDRILHIAYGPRPPVGSQVYASVDRARRLDHIQQHTGQHILSQAFVSLFGAETRAFRMGVATSEIDVDFAGADDARISEVEDLANRTVFEDRPLRVHFVDREGAAALPLRRDSAREGELRVVEIDGFDWSPCGGTHARRTGEVGLLAIRGVERAKGLLRVEFVAGARALADYRAAHRTALETALLFSTGRDEGPAAVRRLMDEVKTMRRRVRELSEIASEVEARRLLDDAERAGDLRLVVRRLDDRSADELRLLAQKVVEGREDAVLALLGSGDAGAARLVFARSAASTVDCGRLMRAACEALGGRGGGRPDLAQGGGPDASGLDRALDVARRASGE